MTYRQSSYDPLAATVQGKPLRPFNWVQWTGVALFVVGVALFLAQLAGAAGLPAFAAFRKAPGVFPMLIGQLLVYSRREELPRLDTEEQRAKNRKAIALTTLVVAAVLTAAAFISLKGA
ncbi:hypothetical protein HMF7854_03495 [Sphingomonas ginkgonis]|uniref:Uncharacterized protein n=1 Tax=Sphingomonas ginkgonis TaxID=2315330 RepID=A0A3R9YHE9_9SPHN|nr:hypothetical protein [Sphingomonas ginkgonis]RST29995.1 hypothetical protein HMF7854_03495 [Sphingomonas ginkgonis]